MSTSAAMTWELDAAATQHDILQALAADFALATGKTSAATHTYYDDADAHLWRAGVLLSHSAKQFCLVDPAGVSTVLDQAPAAKFWWDFPAGPLRAALQPLTGVRALLPVVTLKLEQAGFLLRNGDGKIVVRGHLTRSSANRQAVRYLTLTPLRGYAGHLAGAARICAPFVAPGDSALDPRALLTRLAIPVFAARAKPTLPVTAKMHTEQAVRLMAGAMLDDAQQHVAGVVDDIDTEFLHQFRVNFRKARSLLSLLKKAMPTDTMNALKPRLSAISGSTNRLRDLDVFLLAQQTYRDLLPPDFAAGMDDLAALVRAQRGQEQQRVARYFASAAYRAEMAHCTGELAAPARLETPMASQPVLALVKRQLLKRYAAVLAMSTAIGRGSADDDVHALRIELKKLRYLIEFFLDLLPRKRSVRLLGDMKKLQNVLGDFNDYCVQIDFLGQYVDDRHIRMSKALSGLIAILHVKQTEKRAQVVDALAAFFSESRTIEFSLIFGAVPHGEAQ